jgi:hypothetical protein
MKQRCAIIGLALACWAAAGLRADVTIRYQTEIKPAAALGPLMEPFLKAAQNANSGIAIRMKGNKAYTTAGALFEIFDFVKQEVTLIDPAHKIFAAFPVSEFADQLAAAMPQATPEQAKAGAQAMASIKTKAESKMTGRTAVIQGVQAEERELTITMDIPMPPNMPQTPGPGMRMVMQIWTAKPEEALHNPAIRELTGYSLWQKYILNPAGSMSKIAGKMPGMAETIQPMFEEIFKNQSVILRTHMEMYMPFLAALAKMAGQSQGAPAIDPNAPLMEMNQEVAELSSAPVDESPFHIPKDYTAAPAGGMIRDMLKAQSAAAQAPAK